MTPEIRQQVRLSLLRYLDAAAAVSPQRGHGLALLRQQLTSEGFGLTTSEVHGELVYLEDKGLVKNISGLVSPEVTIWRATAAGRDEYARLSA